MADMEWQGKNSTERASLESIWVSCLITKGRRSEGASVWQTYSCETAVILALVEIDRTEDRMSSSRLYARARLRRGGAVPAHYKEGVAKVQRPAVTLTAARVTIGYSGRFCSLTRTFSY